MRFRHLLAACLCLATGVPASAQSLSRDEGPVNFPPAGFTGTQFADNRGCVYIRAGFQGAETWVPRVGRDRRVLCGQTPTFGNTAAAAPQTAARPAPEAAPAPRTARAPVQTPAATTAARPTAPRSTAVSSSSWLTRTPSPAPEPTLLSGSDSASASGQPRAVVTVREAPVRTLEVLPAVIAPAPQLFIVPPDPPLAPPAAAPAPKRVERVAAAAPQHASPCPDRTGVSARHTNTQGVRCGPQSENPRGHGGTVASGSAGAGTTFAESVQQILNPNPAVLRIEGATAPIPKGYKPVFTDGRHNPQRGLPGGPASLHTGTGVHSGAGVHSVAARAHRPYVQAGTFGVAANAQNAAARLSSMGLPVATQTVHKGGRTLTVVLAGPFSDGGSSARALQQVRAAGYRDAFARR